MVNKAFVSGIPMVNIDGAKVRRLRESNGLTQLFLATSVEVTTDTISRWENKRYPTIKRENGLKLAAALEVDLVDILEDEPNIAEEGVEGCEELGQAKIEPEIQPEAQEVSADAGAKKRSVFPLIGIALFLGCLVLWWLWPADKNIQVRASRVLPAFAPAGQIFPVAIRVNVGNSDETLSLIVKEIVPQGVTVIKSIPPSSMQDGKSSELKWIQKISNKKVFAYLARLSPESEQDVRFNGSITLRRKGQQTKPVHGAEKMQVAPFHWADADGDGGISDEEILTVYDEFSDIDGLALDIDQVEEMWLGSGYRYESESGSYVILP